MFVEGLWWEQRRSRDLINPCQCRLRMRAYYVISICAHSMFQVVVQGLQRRVQNLNEAKTILRSSVFSSELWSAISDNRKIHISDIFQDEWPLEICSRDQANRYQY